MSQVDPAAELELFRTFARTRNLSLIHI